MVVCISDDQGGRAGSSGQQINHSRGERAFFFFYLRSQPPLIISLAPDTVAFEAASQKDLQCLGGSDGKVPLRDVEQGGGVEALSYCSSASIHSKVGSRVWEGFM